MGHGLIMSTLHRATVPDSTPMSSVSVVIPCYCSERTLPTLVDQLRAVLAVATEAYEIVLVDDGSPDDTWSVVRDLAATYPEVRALRLSRNYGQQNALLAGVLTARYDVTVTMDDDLQHPPEEVPRLLEALSDRVELVYGVAVEEEHAWLRSFASRAVKIAMSRGMRIEGARQISAFRAFHTYLRDAFGGIGGPDVALDVALSWATNRAVGVRVRMDRRTVGRSGYRPRDLVAHALNMVLGYSTAPLRAVIYLGLLCATLGVALLAVILYEYFTGTTTVAGFTTISSLVAIFSGAQMLAIGVLGEYIGRIHGSQTGRPTYVVRERVDSRSS